MFSPPMPALPVVRRLRVTKALLHPLLRRLGRVILVRVQVEADAGGAARTGSAYAICAQSGGQLMSCWGGAHVRRQRNRRTRSLSVALTVVWNGGIGIVDGRTHMFRGRIVTSTSCLVGVLLCCISRIARKRVVGIGCAQGLLAEGAARIVVRSWLRTRLGVVCRVVRWIRRLLLLLIWVRLVMRVDVLTSWWRWEVSTTRVSGLLSRVSCILLRWKIARWWFRTIWAWRGTISVVVPIAVVIIFIFSL